MSKKITVAEKLKNFEGLQLLLVESLVQKKNI